MLFVSFFSWWYGAGWGLMVRRAVLRVAGVLDFFSIGLLLRSLFAPFRQISMGRVRGPLGVQIRAWADRQISRVIGAMLRLAVIVLGLMATVVMGIVSLVILLLWPFVPAIPFIVVAVAMGVR